MPNAPRERSTLSTISDCVIIAILYGISLVFEWDTSIHPYQQYIPGLNDATDINYTFEYPMNDSTVPTPVMLGISCATWCLLLILHGILFYKFDVSFTFGIWAKYFYLFTRITMFSFGATSLITDLIKKSVGEPRPFYNEAQREYDNGDLDIRQFDNARQSFVSGHASEAWCIGFLLSLYLYRSYAYAMKCYVMNHKLAIYSCDNPHSYFLSHLWYKLADVPLLSILLIFIPTYFALYVALTRLIDYKHTPSDITAGALLGASISYLTYLIYYDEMYLSFEYKEAQKREPHNISTDRNIKNKDETTKEELQTAHRMDQNK